MVEKALHAGNVSACVGAVVTAADTTFSGGATIAFSGALSALELFKRMSRTQQTLAKEMARELQGYLAQTYLSENRKKIVIQIISDYPPSETDIVENSENAEKIASAMAERVHDQTIDPAQKSSQALKDYKAALIALLTPALAPRDRDEARDQEILRTGHDTMAVVRELQQKLADERAVNRPGFTGDCLVLLKRLYRARSCLHSMPPLPQLA